MGPNGFPTPVHIYKAVEIEDNRPSRTTGCCARTGASQPAGQLRRRVPQRQPPDRSNISSLFDFTNGIIGMLGDQYKKGPLNTIVAIVNIYTSYVIPSGFLKAWNWAAASTS